MVVLSCIFGLAFSLAGEDSLSINLRYFYSLSAGMLDSRKWFISMDYMLLQLVWKHTFYWYAIKWVSDFILGFCHFCILVSRFGKQVIGLSGISFLFCYLGPLNYTSITEV